MKSSALCRTLLLLSTFAILMNFQCEDDDACIVEENTVSLRATITPNTKSVNIGDTLWIESKFETVLPLINKPGAISLDSAECFTSLNVMKVENHTHEIREGLHSFEYFNSIGTLEPAGFQDQRQDYQSTIVFSCGADQCQFRIGMIPQKRGFYCLWIWGGKFGKPGEEELLCPPLNRFRENAFEVEDFNRELYARQNLTSRLRLLRSTTSGYLDVLSNNATYIFEVK